jgi:hypothetical protein
MDDSVILDGEENQRKAKLQELWKAYLEAKDRAEVSRDLSDGIAAGKAWAAWVIPFTEHRA